MSRRLLNLVSVLSLIVCVAVAALWVRSRWHGDHVRYGEGAVHGPAPFAVGRMQGVDDTVAGAVVRRADPAHAAAADRARGGGYSLRECHLHADLFDLAAVPHWGLTLAAGVLPALGVWRWRRGRKGRLAGLCAAREYDLRATPDRCPECGRVPGVWR